MGWESSFTTCVFFLLFLLFYSAIFQLVFTFSSSTLVLAFICGTISLSFSCFSSSSMNSRASITFSLSCLSLVFTWGWKTIRSNVAFRPTFIAPKNLPFHSNFQRHIYEYNSLHHTYNISWVSMYHHAQAVPLPVSLRCRGGLQEHHPLLHA